ncbi:putative short-chain dehydrogenase/reductase SDR [Klebsiella pneumoniae]|uniref:Putative short-chain dehydrogenase/reductase SDR n=1 Tax=Klebsiella pneumoniae TaxID=573 RepID=A0A377TQU6_KLEPN|nr:putative short-chain dehydrogenase/reductase SDR [Klebsiella pneumoniae]
MQVQAAIEQILAKYGRVDVLVNNAGITQPLKLMDIKRANYDAVLDVSLRGTLLMSQAVIPTMRAQKSGSIVCISSVSAQRGGGIFGGPHYSAAKAGVLGLARAMARELGPDNVRVNCITPGLIQTDITAGKLTDDMTANILAGIPMNRLGDAIDIARAALFLGSDLSSYSTGITLDVNGGMLIH